MLHSVCSPAAVTRDLRSGAQPAFAMAPKGNAAKFDGTGEPSLDEMMGDDVVRRVMARDGVHPDHIWSLIHSLRASLG